MFDALILCALVQLPVQRVTDSTTDTLVRLADLNGDDDYNDAGEAVQDYSDTIGPLPLSNNVGLRSTVDGFVLVTDNSEDTVFAFRDHDGDGDFNDPDEASRWFDGRAGGNLSGVLMPAANGLVRASDGTVWVASANSGSTGVDAVLRLRDLDADGDANDAGEAVEWWSAPGNPGGDYIPQAVQIGLDGALYLLDAPSTLGFQKGVYRLRDLNADGDANDAGENLPYFIPPFGAAPFFWCLEVDSLGWFYTADTGNEVVWKFKDLDSDGDAQDPGESFPFWSVGAASNIWDLAVDSNGDVYCSDSQGTSRIIRLRDADGSNSIGANEVLVVYDETLASVVVGNGRGIDFSPSQPAGAPYCFGDAGLCPCATGGNPGKGCPNSLAPGGARLWTSGVASIAADTLSLDGRFMPASSALYFQGTLQLNNGLGTAFGDGLRCAGGSVIRLGTKVNSAAGSSRYPSAGDLPVGVRGQCVAGATRTYQVWYRNAAAFCTPSTFNLTNGVQVAWAP